jgi:hypothetical protein
LRVEQAQAAKIEMVPHVIANNVGILCASTLSASGWHRGVVYSLLWLINHLITSHYRQ